MSHGLTSGPAGLRETSGCPEASPSTHTRLADGLGPKRLPYAILAIRPNEWVPRSRPWRNSAFVREITPGLGGVNEAGSVLQK